MQYRPWCCIDTAETRSLPNPTRVTTRTDEQSKWCCSLYSRSWKGYN